MRHRRIAASSTEAHLGICSIPNMPMFHRFDISQPRAGH